MSLNYILHIVKKPSIRKDVRALLPIHGEAPWPGLGCGQPQIHVPLGTWLGKEGARSHQNCHYKCTPHAHLNIYLKKFILLQIQ